MVRRPVHTKMQCLKDVTYVKEKNIRFMMNLSVKTAKFSIQTALTRLPNLRL